MSLDIIHDKLIGHYRKRSLHKQQKNIERSSIIKQSYQRRNLDPEKDGSKLQDFLRNQSKVAAESDPLTFRDLPRNLKVYFSGPPQAPPKLKQVPYTYEIVPSVPYKIPKQKKGKAAEWVAEQSYFVDSKRQHKKELMIRQRKQSHKYSQLGNRFRSAVKKLANKMKEQNLSLGEIIANNGLVKRPHNFYNSQQFFSLIKKGDLEVTRLLQENQYLVFDIDELKMTALHWAARYGYAQIVNILTVKYRANTMARDSYGRTPLHLAVAKKNTQCIIRIFIQGGKIVALNNAKQSVRDVAPDVYTKFLLEKLQQIRLLIRTKGIKDIEQYKKQLESTIRQSLDGGSMYF